MSYLELRCLSAEFSFDILGTKLSIKAEFDRQAEIIQQEENGKEITKNETLKADNIRKEELDKAVALKIGEDKKAQIAKEEADKTEALRLGEAESNRQAAVAERQKQEAATAAALQTEAAQAEIFKEEQRRLEAQLAQYAEMRRVELAELARKGELDRDVGETDLRAPRKPAALELAYHPPLTNKDGSAAWSEVQRVEDLRQKFEEYQRQSRENATRERFEAYHNQRQTEIAERERARQELERRLEEQRRRDAAQEKERGQKMREIYFDRGR